MKKDEFIAKYGIEAYKKHLGNNRNNYLINHKKILEQHKEYYQNNKDKLIEYQRIHRIENPEYHKEYRKTPIGRAIHLISGYKFSDKKYNRGECTLTPRWIIENIFNVGKCHYCGKELPYTELGCDRKDSNLPHIPENCVPCCTECNCKKKTMSYVDFLNKIST